MIDTESRHTLHREIAGRIAEDLPALDRLRSEIRPLHTAVRRIQPRTTTALSLVGTDGGNMTLRFDPFLIQIVRVVDSSNNEYCLEAITPTTHVGHLGDRQFDQAGRPRTPLARMMAFLGVRTLPELSPFIRPTDAEVSASPYWVRTYRELAEWATLFSIVQTKDFATDTLLVFDGLLRSRVFAHDLFARLLDGLADAIDVQARLHRRRIYLAGVAKHATILARYRLALALEGVLTTDYPAYVAVPRALEEAVYVNTAYTRDRDVLPGSEHRVNNVVGGRMCFVKFGSSRHDPVWPVDLFLPQADQAGVVLGHLLADALDGFPIPFYPRCLQRAHEHAALIDFDADILQDVVLDGIRAALNDAAPLLDIFRLQDADPAQARYGAGERHDGR
jgi:hypothetical protein